MGYEEFLIGAALCFSLALFFSDVYARYMTEPWFSAVDLYRRVGKIATVFPNVVVGLITCLPFGVIAGLIFARRTRLYAALVALPLALMATLPGPKWQPIFLVSSLALLLPAVGGAWLAASVRHRWRVPATVVNSRTPRSRFIARGAADILALLFFIANIAIWRNAALRPGFGPQTTEERVAFFGTFAVCLAGCCYWRWTIRDRVGKDAETQFANELHGIGGWLGLVVVSMVANLIRTIYGLYVTFKPVADPEVWDDLTSPEGSAYHHLWAPLLTFEIAANTIIICLGVATLVLLLRQSRYAPAVAITWLVAMAGFSGMDFVVADLIPAVSRQSDPEPLRGLIRTVVAAAIGIPYFRVSKRVKATFIR